MTKKAIFLRFFLSGLSSLLEAGVPLLKALYSLSFQQTNAWGKNLVHRLILRISCGEMLSEAMKKELKLFPKLIISLVVLGEETSSLPGNLKKGVEYVDQTFRLKAKIYSAFTYPLFLLAVTSVGLFILVKFFIPSFFPVLSTSAAGLPFLAKWLMKFSLMLSSTWFWLGTLAFLAFTANLYSSVPYDPQKKYLLDRFILSLPGAGKVIRTGLFAQLTRTLAAGHSAGLSLAKGLALLEETVENEVFRRLVQDSRLALANGQDLSKFFLARKNFVPPVIGHLMAVGENTGALSFLLLKCSRMLEEETEYAIGLFYKLLEPGILLIMGILVALIMIGVLSPIYGMLEIVR